MSPAAEVLLVAVFTAGACAVAGVFLVLRKLAMMSDATSHAILLGIVLAFFWTHDLGSPWLLVGATATGVLTVWLVELIFLSGNLREDAAIGLVFPTLFSLGVLLISLYAGSVHLDLDAVLMGELAFVPFDRVTLFDRDLGPRGAWTMGALLLLNLGFVGLLYKELKLATFDREFAELAGGRPRSLHYLFMTLVSLTIVGAFDAVGAILVVALIVGPAAAAYLLTDRLPVLLALAGLLGLVAALAGYAMGHYGDLSLAGAMAVMVGVVFAFVALLAPRRGVLAPILRRRRQSAWFQVRMLVVHLSHHHGAEEARLSTLHQHLTWPYERVGRTVRDAMRRGLVDRKGDMLQLTARGRDLADDAVVRELTYRIEPAAD